MTSTIAVIGAGQIGSRHLQALLKSEFQTRIYVVDPDKKSLATAKNRAEEVDKNSRVLQVEYLAKIEDLPDTIDLAVIATTAANRAKVANELVFLKSPRNLVFEKILFQRFSEYDEIEQLLARESINAWVNCPRRVYPIWQHFRARLSERKLYMQVQGGEWGIACNGIHFVDLMAFFTGTDESTYDLSGLARTVQRSKRSGFVEFTGTMRIEDKCGNTIIMHSSAESSVPPIMTVTTEDLRIVVDESQGTCWTSSKDTGWQWSQERFPVVFQSDLTQHIANSILLGKKCELTSFQESSVIHRPYIRAILEYYNIVADCPSNLVCPIT